MKRAKESQNEFVDIHGRLIPAIAIENTGEIAFPLSELKQTGIGIIPKSQYVKLSTLDKHFDEDFHTFMLESAKTYMLLHKIGFTEDQILQSIQNCKKVLSKHNVQSKPHVALGGRVIEEKPNNDILIQVPNFSNPAKPLVPNSRRQSRSKSSVRRTSSFRCSEKNEDVNQGSVPTSKNPKRESRSRSAVRSPLLASPEKCVKSFVKDETFQNFSAQTSSRKTDDQVYQNNIPRRNLRPPQSKILEKVVLSEQKEMEHEVIVTHIDKRNCVWVQDKANSSLNDTIYTMLNSDAQFQQTAPKPYQFEKVYMASDEGSWFRCKVIRYSPLEVFFLDYGNVAEVDDLRTVSEEVAKFPCLAVRLTFREHEYFPCVEDELKIRILKQNDDGTYFVSVRKVEDQEPSFKVENGQRNTRNPETKKASAKYFTRPTPLCTLQNQQHVRISHEEGGILFLRTHECVKKLRDIDSQISNEVKCPLEQVEINQLVLVRGIDGKFYRAVVLKILKNNVFVEYIDYVKEASVNLDSVFNITESLSREPSTYLRGAKLKGFIQDNDQCRDLIQRHIENKSKFYVILEDNDNFDLSDGTRTLSQQLQNLNSDRILLQDMKRYEPAFGLETYLIGYFKDINDFNLVPSEELSNAIDSVMLQEMDDPNPHVPIAGEVCFCFYMDHWYRCVVTRILNTEYEVLLLDFGNVELVTKDNFRKASKQITEIPVLALPCRLVGLPDHPQVESLLQEKIIEGELYKVKVNSVTDGKYNVEIPVIYQLVNKSVVKDDWGD